MSMRKSETGVFLPSIRTHRASLSGRSRMKSFFLERVKQEVSKESSYQAMKSSLINEEQHKLKQILREFNDRSQSILADYISGPAKAEDVSVPKPSAESLKKVLQQQEVVLKKIVDQCQAQLKILQSRCQNLKYVTREDMQKQIQMVRQQIQEMKVSNKDLGRDVTLNGLNICKGERFDQVPDLEYQKAQLEAKRTQLAASSQEISKEIQSVKGRTLAADKEIVSLQEEYRLAVNNLAGSDQAEKLKQVVKERQKQVQYYRGRNEQAVAAIKQKYYTKLKELDDFKTSSKKTAEALGQREEDLGSSRKELIVLEHRLSALKNKGTTIQLLAKK